MVYRAAEDRVAPARPWTADVAALGLGEAVMVLDKPYDLDDLLACVRQAERRAWGQP